MIMAKHFRTVGDAFEIEQVGIAQMRRHHILHRAEHRLDTPWITFIPVTQHVSNHLTLQVRL